MEIAQWEITLLWNLLSGKSLWKLLSRKLPLEIARWEIVLVWHLLSEKFVEMAQWEIALCGICSKGNPCGDCLVGNCLQ